MAAETQRLTDAERDNLVAYLDGELAEGESRALSAKITQSVTARREIEAFQKTWDLLDHLVRPDPVDEFAHRTVSLALAQNNRGAHLAEKARSYGSVAGRLTVLATAAAVALVAGFVATRWAWPDPSARLRRDLPIAEHLDEFREAGSIDFIKLLDQSPEFNEDAE